RAATIDVVVPVRKEVRGACSRAHTAAGRRLRAMTPPFYGADLSIQWGRPMPAGIEHPLLGYASFCAVKFVGYSVAAWVLSRSYKRPDRNPVLVGGVRTLIGMAAGAAYFGVALVLGKAFPGLAQDYGGWLYMAGLLPVRMAEWWLLIWLFYDRR